MKDQPIDIGVMMVKLRIAQNGNGKELEYPTWYQKILALIKDELEKRKEVW